jgi:hypothetical protein
MIIKKNYTFMKYIIYMIICFFNTGGIQVGERVYTVDSGVQYFGAIKGFVEDGTIKILYDKKNEKLLQ